MQNGGVSADVELETMPSSLVLLLLADLSFEYRPFSLSHYFADHED